MLSGTVLGVHPGDGVSSWELLQCTSGVHRTDFRECTKALPSVLANTIWVRFRDNFVALLALLEKEDQEVAVRHMFDALKLLTGMDVTGRQRN